MKILDSKGAVGGSPTLKGKQMTRKQALKRIDDIMGTATVFAFVRGHIEELINEIFDGFEKGKNDNKQ